RRRTGRHADVLWSQHLGRLPASGRLCGQDSERREAGRSSCRATDEVRPRDQHANRQGARPHDPAVTAGASERGHSVNAGRAGHRTMKRRAFVAGLGVGVTSWPRVARDQSSRQIRVGWLSTGRHPFIDAFRQGLRDLGYVEGRNLVIEERYAEGKNERLPELARDLIRANVDVVVTSGGPATRAAARAAPTLPVVGVAGDLVAAGLVRSLAHPGGNVTGFNTLSQDLAVKWIEFFKAAVPKLARVAVLLDTAPGRQRQQVEATARQLGLQLVTLEARD